MKHSYFRLNIIAFILIFVSFQALYAKDYKLTSPDGTILLTISVKDKITYTLFVDGQQVMDHSMLSMVVNGNTILGEYPKVHKSKYRLINQKLYPQLQVKSKEIVDNFNELTLSFKGRYSIFFRAYNNGVAYRFKTSFKKELIVNSEEAKFNFIEWLSYCR